MTENVTAALRPIGRRPPDPARAEHIARAVLAVIAEHGVEGVTHRRAAEVAQVPLGSTTYYFKSLDHLLEVAFRLAVQQVTASLKAWSATIPPGSDPVQVATNLVLWRAGENSSDTIAAKELYLAARYRPNLRPLALDWGDQIMVILLKYTDDPLTARVLDMVIEGCLARHFVTGSPLDRGEVEALITRAIGKQAG